MTDDELAIAIEIYVKELAKHDYKRARQLITRLAITLIDDLLDQQKVNPKQ